MTEFPALREVEGKLANANAKLKQIFDEAGPEIDLKKVKCESDPLTAIRSLKEEADELGKKRDELLIVQKAAEHSRSVEGAREGEREVKGVERKERYTSFGDMVIKSDAVRLKRGPQGPSARLDVDLKGLFETGGSADAANNGSYDGWTPETTRTGKVVEYATRPIQVADIFPTGSTQQQAVVYMEETTFTNAAAEVLEADEFPEATLGLEEKSSPVRKIAVWLPVTDEQLEDEAHARSYINNRLPFMLRQRLDSQLLNGNGSAPNLLGVMNVSGVQSQAKDSDPVPDAIYKAMTKVRVTGRAQPDHVLLHSNDWQEIRLLRTADGVYIWGAPMEAGQPRIWGLPVVENDVISEGTALVGDFGNFSELVSRRGIDVQITNSHDDYFIHGKQAIRADIRCALVVYRPTAFCKVTGI